MGASPFKVCYFGAYDLEYPRNQVLRKGLALAGVEVVQCQASPRVGVWEQAWRLFRAYSQIPKDFAVILVAEMNQMTTPLAWLFARVGGQRLVTDFLVSLYNTRIEDKQVTSPGSLKARRYFYTDRLALSIGAAVIADTRQHLEYFHRTFGVAQDRMHVIYVGADDGIFDPDRFPYKPSPTFRVVFFGKYVPLHGIEYILHAAKILEIYRDIHFELRGSGQTFPQAQELARKLGLRNVDFLEWVPILDLAAWLGQADLCLGIFGDTAKARRVIPHKVFQSLAMRRPVITGDSPAVCEVFADGEHLFLCPMADATALAEAILRLKEDTNLRQRIAQSGYRLIRDRFTPRTIGRELRKVLESVL